MIKHLTSSTFTRHTLTLLSGSAAAQALTLALSPLLTRLYTPEEFGVFAFFVAAYSLLAVWATGQYHHAIMLPKHNDEAFQLTGLCLIISIIFSALILLFFTFTGEGINTALESKNLGGALYGLPLAVLAAGFIATLNMWFTRQKEFRKLTTTTFTQSIVNNTISLSTGSLISGVGSFGLIGANILAQLYGATRLFKHFITTRPCAFNGPHALRLAKRYKNFFKITTLQSSFAILTRELPTLIIGTLYDVKLAGFYFLAYKVCQMPAGLLSQSIYQVYLQHFSTASNKRSVFIRTFFKLNALLAPCFLAAWVFTPYAVPLIFGQMWAEAALFIQITLPLVYAKLISNIFTTSAYIVFERQFENFIFSMLIALSTLLALLFGTKQEDLTFGLLLMVSTNISFIIIKLIRSYQFTTAKDA